MRVIRIYAALHFSRQPPVLIPEASVAADRSFFDAHVLGPGTAT